MKPEIEQCDVAIIGSGIAGASLASILARHGHRVVVFEAGSHPRFAIGESMILETSEVMRTLAELYSVPELAYFSSENYIGLIGTSHGVKRHFSYLHHKEGEAHDYKRTLQAVIPKKPHGHELHLYRQDVDAFLANTAVSYGATVLQNTPVTQIDVDEDGVTIAAGTLRTRARYVVDAAGFRSPLAGKFGLRDFDLQTHSRALFTHMIDLRGVQGVTQKDYALPFSLSEGTLHHVFEGGWLWVIPFNNHARSTNPLASVGLMLDPRVHPQRDDLGAAEEFYAFLEKFPSIAKQFEGAKAVRPWTRTGRIQYSSSRVVGDRWALLGHAAGFIDPLYSKGLYTSLTGVSVLADLLLKAKETGDYSREAFMSLETKTLAFIRANDTLVANSYKSFSHYRLWQAYSVLWLLGAYTELVKLMSARAGATSREGYYLSTTSLRLVGGGFRDFERLSEKLDAVIGSHPENETGVDDAVAYFKETLSQTPWLPEAFKEVLNGKNHLPRRKLRLGLLRRERGFLGEGAYREHFFGGVGVARLVSAFVRETFVYSARSLKSRARKNRFGVRDKRKPRAGADGTAPSPAARSRVDV